MQYGEIALVYDSLMYDMPYDDWAEFLLNHLKGAETVLEFGCGTGSITERLSAYYDITAVDISDDMLDIARQKLTKKGRSARFVKVLQSPFFVQGQPFRKPFRFPSAPSLCGRR